MRGPAFTALPLPSRAVSRLPHAAATGSSTAVPTTCRGRFQSFSITLYVAHCTTNRLYSLYQPLWVAQRTYTTRGTLAPSTSATRAASVSRSRATPRSPRSATVPATTETTTAAAAALYRSPPTVSAPRREQERERMVSPPTKKKSAAPSSLTPQAAAASDAAPLRNSDAKSVFSGSNEEVEQSEKALTVEDVSKLLSAAERLMKVPNINTYDLHTMEEISEDMVDSVTARKLLFPLVSNFDRMLGSETIAQFTKKHRNHIPAAAVYVRIVHPSDVFGASDAATASSLPAKRREKGKGHQQQRQEEVAAVRAAVEKVLRRYVCRLIEPFPNELAMDLTHYRTFLPLLTAGRRNVAQFLKDAEDFIQQRPVHREGVPGGPPPAGELEPISTDVLAAEIARLIRSDVLLPRYNASEAAASAVTARHDVVRVCLGVATTAVMAKVACDAEVAAVARRVQAAHTAGSKRGAGDGVPLVSVRSLLRHTATPAATFELIAHLPLTHIPLLTPAFAELLHRVFDVRTCSDLESKKELLGVCVSPNTLQTCVDIVSGCMKFPVEETVSLMSHNNLVLTTSNMRQIASNAISVVNESRTRFVASMENSGRNAFRVKAPQSLPTTVSYGRLRTDAEVTQDVRVAVDRMYARMHHMGLSCRRVNIRLTENRVAKHCQHVDFEPGLSKEALKWAVESVLGSLLQHRRRDVADGTAAVCFLTLLFQRLEPVVLIPPAMMEEARELQDVVMYTKRRMRQCTWVKRKFRLARGKFERKPKTPKVKPEAAAAAAATAQTTRDK